MLQQKHGGNVWMAEQTYGVKREQILDFSANINPLGPSPKAMEALQKALATIKHYPEPQAGLLRKKLARLTGLSEEYLIMGNGAAELIYALGKVLKPKRVILPVPTFSEYAEGFTGIPFIQIQLNRENDFILEPEAFLPVLEPGDLIIICNPNNPTGQLVQESKLKSLLERATEIGAWVMIDEAFMDFVYPEQSLLKEVANNPLLLVLRSLTKFFAIPGLRLGYLAAAPEIVQQLTAVLPPWRVNSLAQTAGLASLEDQEYIDKTFGLISSQRIFLTSGLGAIPGLQPLAATANFILVDCSKSGHTVGEIQDYLGPKGILIRQCDNFVGLNKYYFRVAVRSEDENKMLIHQLWEFINHSCI